MTAGCVADMDVAVSIYIVFQRLFCKSLHVVSKVLLLVLVAPVLVNITAIGAIAAVCVQDIRNYLHP